MLISDLTKQGKQELHTFSFLSLHALSHPYGPMKGRGPVPTLCEKESLLGQERKWEQVWAQDACLEWLLNVLPHVPPSDAPSDSFPLFSFSNRDKLYTAAHHIWTKIPNWEEFPLFITKPRTTRTCCVVKCSPAALLGKHTLISLKHFYSISILARVLSVT